MYLAFGGNTRELGSFGEETNETTDLHQHLSRLCSQWPKTASQDTRDAVTIHPTTVSQEITTALENQLLSVSLLICLGKLDCVERISSAEGDLRKFSDRGAWYAIEGCAQYDKKCSNPTSAISDEKTANPNAQIVRDDMVRVQVPRCMAWLNYDEHVDSLSTMDNEVEVTSPTSTIQTLSSFKEYTPPVTYLEEVEKTLGTPMEVEPLNKTN
nr:hypothetical protein [Tanacetum cinerariifolium]